MFIYYVLLFLSALIFASQFFVTRQYQMRNGTGFLGSVKLSFFAYLTIAVFFFVKGCLTKGTLNFGFTWFTFAITLLIAVVSLSCVYMGIKVLSVGDMSIYSVFMMLGSLILPSLVGVIVYEEPLTPLKAIALLLMFTAIIFSVSSVDKNKLTLKALLYYVGIFIMNGMIGVFFTVHQNQPEMTAAVMNTADGLVVNNDVFMTWYGISTVLLSGVIYGVWYLLKKVKPQLFKQQDCFDDVSVGVEATIADKKTLVKAFWITVGLSAIYGLCNGVGDYFIAIATQPNALGASVTFPIINGGTIVFSTLSGIVFFKEKLTVSTIISLVIVVVSTVLFMFV